jgi:formiminotetrahydrofolate cyclodeaminase
VIEVPLTICELAVKASGLFTPLQSLSGPSLRSDLKAGQALLKGSFTAAWAMVEVNLRDLAK